MLPGVIWVSPLTWRIQPPSWSVATKRGMRKRPLRDSSCRVLMARATLWMSSVFQPKTLTEPRPRSVTQRRSRELGSAPAQPNMKTWESSSSSVIRSVMARDSSSAP